MLVLNIIEQLWSIEWIDRFQQLWGPGWSPEDFRHAPLTKGMEVLTYLGGHETAALLGAVALWTKSRRLAYALLGIVLVTLGTDMALWYTFDVPRPNSPEIFIYKQAPVASFPSGHTVVATAIWGLLAARGHLSKWVAGIFIVIVMVSRLYLGMHYTGDIIAGLLIGLLIVWGYEKVWPHIHRWFGQRSYQFFVWIGLGLVVALFPFTFLNDRAWIAFGAALGGILGLLAEYRYLDYEVAASTPWWWQVAKVLLGLLVATVILFGFTFLGIEHPAFDAAIFGVVAFWATFGAPALFEKLEQRLETVPSA